MACPLRAPPAPAAAELKRRSTLGRAGHARFSSLTCKKRLVHITKLDLELSTPAQSGLEAALNRCHRIGDNI
ncbi:hypothetical protein EVAR_19759_1 [Eumeta japonica]|uniref:Uncharacterized protein n=1 Tax=Eumeta variegata TaxID=151549 RepID=A0A4C1UQJ8_EUMVA|nr:hypothetical protein EVAR_19759_1 [Eumeta japonica]